MEDVLKQRRYFGT